MKIYGNVLYNYEQKWKRMVDADCLLQITVLYDFLLTSLVL